MTILTKKNELSATEKIHKEGRQAYIDGLRSADNPYPFCEDEWDLKYVAWKNWLNGWRYQDFVEGQKRYMANHP